MTTLTSAAISDALLVPCSSCQGNDCRDCQNILPTCCHDQIRDAHAVALVKIFSEAAHDYMTAHSYDAEIRLKTTIARARSYGFIR